jgi:hypothetical protein
MNWLMMELTERVWSFGWNSALDLPYVVSSIEGTPMSRELTWLSFPDRQYSTEGKIKEPNLLADAGQGLLSAGMSYMRGDVGGMLSGVMGLGKKIINQNSGAADKVKQWVDLFSMDRSAGPKADTVMDIQDQDQPGGCRFLVWLQRWSNRGYLALESSNW